MALVSTYDASTFVEGNFATYPPLPAGVALYQPSMYWYVDVAGTVQGQEVAVGDLLFATQGAGRLYGDGDFGGQAFGGLSDGNWAAEQVYFLRWDASAPPPDLVPYPNAGCPFTRDDLPDGNWAPGWRLVVDAYYDDRTGTRRYGDDLYGDGVYGTEVEPLGGPRWVDLTQPAFRIETGDGMSDGSPRVTVAEVVVTIVDDAGVWADIAEPATWYQPQPGTPLRVGLIDPTYTYHPVITAEIERVEDVHDDEHPRVVNMRGFGRIMDLVVDMPSVQRPAELASDRFRALVTEAGWTWDDGAIVFPPDDAMLLADEGPRDIVVRDELDRTCRSVGWFLDSDRRGRMRLRRWPHEPVGPPIVVADCLVPGYVIPGAPDALVATAEPGLYDLVPAVTLVDDDPSTSLFEVVGAALIDPEGDELYAVSADPVYVDGSPAGTLVSPRLVFVNDESQMLNRVVSSNTAAVPAGATLWDDVSKERFGWRGRAFGFPALGLAWAAVATAEAWMRRVLNRFAFITRHAESFEVDTQVDPAWLATLAELDTGRAAHITRNGITLLELDAVVVGWRHTIEPGRWQSTVFTSTTTTSM